MNAVCPGFIRTPMVERVLDKGTFSEEQIFAAEPMHRMGQARGDRGGGALAVLRRVVIRDRTADAGRWRLCCPVTAGMNTRLVLSDVALSTPVNG